MTLADAASVAGLTGELGYPAGAEETSRRLELVLGDPDDHRAFVAVDTDDAPVGWVHVERLRILERPPSARLGGLVVAEGRRSAGIGAALLAQAEVTARSWGCGTLVVASNVVRERAHRFYEAAGYRRAKTQHVFEKELAPGAETAEHDRFPEATLETDRLLLRPYRAGDAADVRLACSDAEIQRWLPLPNPYTDAAALAWCAEQAPSIRLTGEGVQWAAVRRSDDRLVGSFGLTRTDWRGRTTEIGYWVAPWARGEGLATEAVAAIGRWALVEQRFERLALRAATENRPSQRVAEKAGFVREGIARSAGFTNAGRVDLVVFSLVPSDLDRP